MCDVSAASQTEQNCATHRIEALVIFDSLNTPLIKNKKGTTLSNQLFTDIGEKRGQGSGLGHIGTGKVCS